MGCGIDDVKTELSVAFYCVKSVLSSDSQLYVNKIQSTTTCTLTDIQGDHSACSKPRVDIDLKVAFYCANIVLSRDSQLYVNKIQSTTTCTTLYMYFN